MLRINDQAPNFTAETSQRTMNFHEWMGNGWAILFSHPRTLPRCAPRNWAIWRAAAGIREAELQDHRVERGPAEQSQ